MEMEMSMRCSMKDRIRQALAGGRAPVPAPPANAGGPDGPAGACTGAADGRQGARDRIGQGEVWHG